MPPFSKVLVANRGEIAVRIFRTLRELGIASIAVYSEADRDALHVARADDAYLIGGPSARESYLNQARIVETAVRAGAEAVHPGYGFLAENAAFARAVEKAGLVWIGPPALAIELMGHKTDARRMMRDSGVPIIPGSTGPVGSATEVVHLGREIGYPLLIKATGGGGGKGMKVVRSDHDAERAFESAQREGQSYFGDPRVYVEHYLEDPRHIEVQVLADMYGNVIHLGERDCTIQRRYQKLVEEAPSPVVDDDQRAHIGQLAVDAAHACGYQSAGTVEGLLAQDGSFFFMEMNTRIQVEHTVTEVVTGLDLIREQILIAVGEPLWLRQEDVRLTGHAIECRINAEDPANGFLPSPGRITRYREPAGPGVRIDSGVDLGREIPPFYDPMIGKLIVHGVDREHARRRMLRALDEFEIGGVTTLLGFHRALLSHPCFIEGATCQDVVGSAMLAERAQQLSQQITGGETPSRTGVPLQARFVSAEVDGRRYEVRLLQPEPPWRELARRRRERTAVGAGAVQDAVVSPMRGTVLAVRVAEGDLVQPGQVLCIVEAMKMENEVHAQLAGVVADVSVAAGDHIKSGQVICRIVADGSPG